MMIIKKLSGEIRSNIHEAREKINAAYRMRDKDKAVADWYRDMATAHIGFNTTGHNIVVKLIDQAKAEHANDPMIPGMTAVYNEIHADLKREAAEVQAMISAYK